MIFSSLISQSTLHLISFILLATLLSKVDLNESHQCGRISVDTLRKERIIPPSNTRIVGGTPVRPYQYPWMVYVESEYQFQPSSPVNRDHIRSSRSSLLSLYGSCGGTLIDAQWILTAAHCFASGFEQYKLSKVVVSIGVHNLGDTSEATRMEIVADKIFRHPQYNDSLVESLYDIALIKLTNPINLSHPHYGTICLPHDDYRRSVSQSECQTLGWGKVSESGKSSSVLKSVNVPMYSGAECSELEDRESVSSDLQVCAGSSGSGPCKGDSGGPLQCRSVQDNSWVLTGITSYSDFCGGSKPAVFTSVAAFMPWIDRTRSDER